VGTGDAESTRADLIPGEASGTIAERDVPRWAGSAIGFGILVLALRVMGSVRSIDLDLFHEMALIREALVLGRIPIEDVFAYTSSVSPVVHHEWGTGAVLYFVVVGLGLGANGLVLLRLLLLAGVAACCVAVARSRGAGWREMAMVAPLGIILFWPGLSPIRAHMFTFLFLALLLLILERERKGDRRWLLLWPLLFVLWLNMHGGFVVGVGLLGLYAGERFLRIVWETHKGGAAKGTALRDAFRGTWHLFLAVAVSAPLLVVNPYGLDYVPYIWHAVAMERPYMPEWEPLWSANFRGAELLLFLVAVALAGYTLWRGTRWKQLPGLLMLLAAAVFAARSVRILPIFVVVWFAYTSPALASTPLSSLVGRLWARHARALAAVTLVVSAIGMGRMLQKGEIGVVLPTQGAEHRLVYPAGATAYLSEIDFRGNLMTPFGVGAYVSWQLYPNVRVGMDSRYEVAYSPEFAEETMRIYRGDGDWREFLDRHPTDAVLVPSLGPLDSLMTGSEPGMRGPPPSREDSSTWIEVFRDDAYAIFARPAAAGGMPRVDRTGQPITGTFP
jgi:hypothetical protein